MTDNLQGYWLAAFDNSVSCDFITWLSVWPYLTSDFSHTSQCGL